MIDDTGLAALWLAAALALVQVASGARPVAVAQAVIAAIATIALLASVPDFTLFLAAALVLLALFAIYRRSRWSRRAPTANVGLSVAAGGALLLAIGAICDRVFIVQTAAVAKPGDRLRVGSWLVQFVTVNPVAGSDYTAIEAELRASRGSGVSVLDPQARTMIAPPEQSIEPAFETFWNGRLTASFDDRRQVQLRWQPFLPLIWLGGAMIALSALIVLIGQSVRQWRRRPPPRGRYG